MMYLMSNEFMKLTLTKVSQIANLGLVKNIQNVSAKEISAQSLKMRMETAEIVAKKTNGDVTMVGVLKKTKDGMV